MKTHNETILVNHRGVDLHLYRACPEGVKEPLPTVLIFPTWAGSDLFVQHKANLMALQGYIGVVVDLYGQGRQGETVEECTALMMPFVEDREFLRDRIKVIMEHVLADPQVDPENIAATGYCFGGLCVMDTVRNNFGLKAGISIHGFFNKPNYKLPEKYTAKVLALHGFQDPMVQLDQLRSVEQELHKACDDWQLVTFGQGKHAFTNPDAFDETRGTVYNVVLDKRTTKYVNNFLQEIFTS